MGSVMRKLGAVRSVVLVANEPFEIIANDRRVALLFSPPVPTAKRPSYTINTDRAVAPGEGLNLAPGGGHVLITEELYGDAVQKSWYAVSAAAVTFGFLETVRAS